MRELETDFVDIEHLSMHIHVSSNGGKSTFLVVASSYATCRSVIVHVES